jgi:capsular polysaccharide export protein
LYFTLSPELAGIPNLGRFLDGQINLGLPIFLAENVTMVGWGRKRSHDWAARYAQLRGIPCLSLEDGFLRSMRFGRDDPPLSIVQDDMGIYYDALTPSRLEMQIAAAHSDEQRIRARSLSKLWSEGRLSKYNHARETDLFPEEPYVLVADQTWGDASVRYGLSDRSNFQRMLEAALEENPHRSVLLKVHPEVAAGRKRGHLELAAVSRLPRVLVVGEDVHPASLIERADAVYTVTSQIGFEGLLWGKPVRTFGMPFYAGWGLTEDDLVPPARRKPVALEDLIYAALVEYPRYIDPETRQRCEVERLIEWMALQRSMRERFPPRVYAKGFSFWKRSIVRGFFQGSEVQFLRTNSALPQSGRLATWGAQPSMPLLAAQSLKVTEAEPNDIVHLEDGFLRSVGLGTDLTRPLSWVMDCRGIYYDSTRPSDLEHLLQSGSFDEALLLRAAALRKRIVELGLTKYNVGQGRWRRPAEWQRVILVPGQVETDASIAFGAPAIRRNIDLLRAVRAANPGVYVVYKPHPDVVAGLRKRGSGEGNTTQWCDEVVTDCAIASLFEQVDEVHVLTSLAGFEALLRGKKVVTYGQPFYAGWGLTDDTLPVARRTRRLSLDELTAGALILYPTYVSRTTSRFTTPERVIDELINWRNNQPHALTVGRKLMRVGLRMAKR